MQSLAMNTVSVARRGVCMLQKRAVSGQTFLSGPPKNRVSLAEKFAHGGVMFLGMFFVPAWVMGNLESYQKGGSD
ncbi:Hypothetical predicted protein [Cloeon dipterum]|uniref:Uncharacterized protein n=1 Tax=Cloeon dipterum TaxID=197152 RepID=A0A8S1CGV0_9INSE|nr:Hypothetical predicted protein [Cloeon dipterum]